MDAEREYHIRKNGSKGIFTKRKVWLSWIGYLAFVWSISFAAIHVYWAFGGTAGFEGRTMHHTLMIINGVAIGLSVVAAGLALAMVQAWGRRIPSWVLLTMAWGASLMLGLRGLVGISQSIINNASDVPSLAIIFEPAFLVGGILFGLLAVIYKI